ncbi:MAG: HNH endonuclease [bacterium]
MLQNHRVLVLNSTYEAINVCTARRAIKLLLCGIAHSVESSPYVISSPTRQFHLPEVIRLRRYVRIPYRPVPFCRRNILLRDSHRCQYCGTKKPADHLTIDHLIPISRGGGDDWTNVVAACKSCNHRKGNYLPEEAGMRLLHRPRTPNLPSFLHLVRIMGENRATWRKYLFFDYTAPTEEVAV